MSNIPPTVPVPGGGGGGGFGGPTTGGPGGPPPGPPGGFGGPPGGYGGPPGPPPDGGSGFRFTRNHLIAIGVVILLLLAAIGGVLLLRSEDASADEVFLEPQGENGDNPFTNSVTVNSDASVQSAIDNDARSSSGSGVQSFDAGEAGLYGGTLSNSHCDRGQLVAFLEANPDKARAWADVQGITVAAIEDFVDDLTPVLLREDTRVTNHGFVNGTANAIPAVLQAGTAVLVDRFGRPVVRCACGNPLRVPTPASSPRYSGPRWTGFSDTTITVIQQTTVEIDVFVLTDPLTGERFRRPAGTAGDEDEPGETEPPPTTTTSTTTTTTTSTTLAPPPPEPDPPSNDGIGAQPELERRLAQCSGVVFPYEEHVSETITTERLIGSEERVTLTGTTATGNQQVFSWIYDGVDSSLTPESALARDAVQYCSALSG